MRKSSIAALAVALLSTVAGTLAQDAATDHFKIRLEFLGKDPAVDWAKAASALVDKQLVPIKSVLLQKGQNPCSAVLEQLKFRDLRLGCADEVEALIKKLNPGLPSSMPVGQSINYPELPITQMNWDVGFDSTIPAERNRFDRVNSAWKQFKVDERTHGTFRQLEFKGIATEFDVPVGSDTTLTDVKKTIDMAVDHFNADLNRYDMRALAIRPDPPDKVRFAASDTPVDWVEACTFAREGHPAPPPPGPSYISLINWGGDGRPSCATNCKKSGSQGCPRIVLIDQKVANHPDLAKALGLSTAPDAEAKWCPLRLADEKTEHGTHMAGIMVSSGAISAFQGIAPEARLDNRADGGVAINSTLNELRDHPELSIYVYASQFISPDILDNNERLHKPPQVENILQGRGLWVVAAGQQDVGREIGPTNPMSPMNLGDQRNVLVVTNCEDCYKNQAKISQWANYSRSRNGLVNVAAPGGTKDNKIPSTVSETEDGLAHGTSQATALVGGLAAEMASCYPQRYVDGGVLKTRLLATSQPLVSPEMADKVSAGVVDAKMALLDPGTHWVTLDGDVQRGATNLFFCNDYLNLKDVDTDEWIWPIQVKNIKRIVRRNSAAGTPGWVVFYEFIDKQWYQGISQDRHVIRITPVARVAVDSATGDNNASPAGDNSSPGDNNSKPPVPKALLYFRGGDKDLVQDALPLDRVADLLVGLDNVFIAPAYKGCAIKKNPG